MTEFSPERRRDFAYGLPAVAVLAAVLFAAIRANVQAGNIDNKYRGLAQKAFREKNFPAAKTYYGRLVNQSGAPNDYDLLNWAICMSQTGDPERSATIIQSLAPDDKVGFKTAHRLRALALAGNGNLRHTRQPDVVSKLLWHLKNCGDDQSAEIQYAWSEYYLAIDQKEKALECLQRAAVAEPPYLLLVAELCRSLGKQAQLEQALADAEVQFCTLREQDPTNPKLGVTLANILVQRGQLDEAEILLLKTLKINDIRLVRRALADYYLLRHQQLKRANESFAQQFKYLQRAIETDVSYVPAYEQLVQMYQENEIGRKEIRSLLERLIAVGDRAAMAHFSLSNILWLENKFDEARWHVEKAYDLDPRFTVIANNLAWFLAHSDPPDLDRAYELASDIVRRIPSDGRYRDTLATILMKQDKLNEAITEFEKALPNVKDQEKSPIHEKLATLYLKLGKMNLARLHQQQAEKSFSP
jgi:tetratricopeptide (TPR) repeat protein